MLEKSASISSWKTTERIAAILEKSLSPMAKVEHDVRLPVIGKPKRNPRQCDIVVTYGQEPRQSIAIVEVQKRRKKPDINTFHGWMRKMSEVGAQQLICVSDLGYPASVIDEVATRIGPTVKLMTLEEIEKPGVSGTVFMLPYLISITPKYKIEEIGPIAFSEKINVRTIEFNSHSKVFSIGNNTDCINLDELTTTALNNTQIQSPSSIGTGVIDTSAVELVFGVTEPHLWLHYQDRKIKISKWSIKVQVTVEKQVLNIPMTQFVYRQEFQNGVLAWIATTHVPFQGITREIHIVFKPDGNGYLQIAAIT